MVGGRWLNVVRAATPSPLGNAGVNDVERRRLPDISFSEKWNERLRPLLTLRHSSVQPLPSYPIRAASVNGQTAGGTGKLSSSVRSPHPPCLLDVAFIVLWFGRFFRRMIRCCWCLACCRCLPIVATQLCGAVLDGELRGSFEGCPTSPPWTLTLLCQTAYLLRADGSAGGGRRWRHSPARPFPIAGVPGLPPARTCLYLFPAGPAACPPSLVGCGVNVIMPFGR